MTTISEADPAIFIIVDDDTVCRQSFRRALKKIGAANLVLEARDGAEALDLLHAEWEKTAAPSVVILLDQHMPGMGGTEFVETLAHSAQFDPVQVFPMGVDLTLDQLCPNMSSRAVGLLDKCDPLSGVKMVFNTLFETPATPATLQ